MNVSVIAGNLTRDPELRYSTGQKQTAICRFTVAVNERYGDKPKTNYIPITAFGRLAENCDKYLAKGSQCLVKGRISTGSYTNNEGQKVYTTEILADEVKFLGSKSGGGEQAQAQQSAPVNQDQPNQGEPQQEGFIPMADDDIPF